MFKFNLLKILSALLILEIIFSNGFFIFAQTVPTIGESKTFYFKNQNAQLADSHILSVTPPAAGNSSLTSITSTDLPSFRHFHPGRSNFQHIFSQEPAHTPPVDSASWISDTPLNGTFQTGSWRFLVHKNDNIKGEVSVPHFNVYSSPSNTNLDQAVFLFDAEGPDWWTSSDEQLNFSTPSLGQFEFNNAYLIMQLFDHCKSGCNGGKIMTVFEDGTTAAAQTRIETPLFTQAGSVPPNQDGSGQAPDPQPPVPPAPPAPEPPAPPVPEPPVPPVPPVVPPPADTTAPVPQPPAQQPPSPPAQPPAPPSDTVAPVPPAPQPPVPPTPSQPEPPVVPPPAPPPPPVIKNSPPVITPIPAQTVIIGTPVTFQVLATDADGDKLTFSLGPDVPKDAKIDPVTGVFSWLPQVIGATSLEILVSDGVNAPVTTGRLVENRNLGADGILGTEDDIFIGGMATWAMVKAQSRGFLGIMLDDMDALNLPLLATDAYGNFIKGPNGFPQLVAAGASPSDPRILIEGNPTSPVDASAAIRTNHPFLADISHQANPVNSRGVAFKPDSDNVIGLSEPGTYDNELLDAHFVAGDGRVNENIGLTAVHHIFHSEHNRLLELTKNVILETKDLAFLNQWLIEGSKVQTFPQTVQETAALHWNGERLFQAAKFGTEMQYQHLVFEEFARKIQPQVNIFSGYHTDIDPAIAAEFAHTVYRFGHSMLTDTVSRTNPDGSTNDIGLIQAFLNPLEFISSGVTPESAAGSIASGMVKQVGNEIDEFVTESLRSNLLGLPLDLAAINLARGRDTGVPPLNAARKQFFVATGGDSALKPYLSWTDFGLNIKHPESLINFIAAYGTHPTIEAGATLAAKRAASALLTNGGEGAPLDRLDFLNSTGEWVNDQDGLTATGLDAIDFWIGGLAEKQMPFGGLLGSSFNFVFETQMEKLQDGDRLYYLSRNAGLNFLTQLEQNSFAEVMMRNTQGVKHPPHDVFSHLAFTIEASEINPVNLPPDTIIMPDGTIRYTGIEHIVMGGTNGRDLLHSSEGDDTLWGDGGNDRLEGGAGNDAIIGGEGDDILTDIFGDDNIKGEAGNDVINGGAGLDLILGGDGEDFVVGGEDSKEIFGGLGNDFIRGSDAADEIFGNEGDDWIEGGNQADLLQGDNGNPFQDSTTIGNDVIVGGGGNDDYDSESGDDIMLADGGIERNEGMLGFDWVIYKNDPQPANADMFITGLLPPSVNDLRDRFDLVEGLSGGRLDDILRGDNRNSVDLLALHANSGQNNALNNPSQTALINGLQSLLGDEVTSFASGNIILGGGGSDLLEGRGGDDVIDGDAWLNVRLSVRDSADPNKEILSADNMKELQAAMFEGRISPAQVKIIREILSDNAEDDIDTAVFSGNLSDYTISNPDTLGRILVTDNRQAGGGGGRDNDGVDTLRNIERLQFADQIVDLGKSNTVGSPTLSINPFIASGVLPSKGGLTFIKSDLEFILDQIKVSEAHAQGTPLSILIPKDLLPWGLRTVDGTFNNIVAGQTDFGAADRVFPRLTTPVMSTAGNVTIDLDGPGPLTLGQPTSYSQTNGFVFDSQPRLISNLIVDQTLNNPAALAASSFAVPAPGNTLFIPNVATDLGLSAPFNSWFTLFGQFFDHGLDLVNKGGSGTVFIPLLADDPLFNPQSRSNFMVLTRATNQSGPDGVLGTSDDIHEHINQTSPFVDQNQTYASHSSHQVFLRAFNFRLANISSVSTGITVTPLFFSVAGQGRFASTTGQATTPKVVSLGTSVVSVEVAGGTNSVTVPDGTEISKSDGSSIDITALTALEPAADSLTGLDTGLTVNGKLQWGIPNHGLLFSNPITLDIFVGTDLNGQTLDVLRSETGTSGWTNDGIVVPAKCVVSQGICNFQATKASVYIAAKIAAVPPSTVPSSAPTPTPTPTPAPDQNGSGSVSTSAPTPTPSPAASSNQSQAASTSNSNNNSSSNNSSNSNPSNSPSPSPTSQRLVTEVLGVKDEEEVNNQGTKEDQTVLANLPKPSDDKKLSIFRFWPILAAVPLIAIIIGFVFLNNMLKWRR